MSCVGLMSCAEFIPACHTAEMHSNYLHRGGYQDISVCLFVKKWLDETIALPDQWVKVTFKLGHQCFVSLLLLLL